jgi:hypothetical protein
VITENFETSDKFNTSKMGNKINELIKLLEVEIDTHETAHKIMEERFDISAERKTWKSISVLVADIKQASKTEIIHEVETKALPLNVVKRWFLYSEKKPKAGQKVMHAYIVSECEKTFTTVDLLLCKFKDKKWRPL